MVEEFDDYMRESPHSKKKAVHFGQTAVGHIELKDLKEKDFHELIESKN